MPCYTGAAGGVAGIIAGQPLDVVRVRLQQKAPNAKGLASMWQLIVKQEGMRSLFKGAAYPITTIAMQVMLALLCASNSSRKILPSTCTTLVLCRPETCKQCCLLMQNAVVFYSYGVGCRWLASKDASRTSTKEPLKLWQVYAAGEVGMLIPEQGTGSCCPSTAASTADTSDSLTQVLIFCVSISPACSSMAHQH